TERQRARLDHEVRDDPMDGGGVVDARRSEPQELADRFRGFVRQKLELDLAFRGFEYGAVFPELRGRRLDKRILHRRWRGASRDGRDHDALRGAPLRVGRRGRNLLHDLDALDDASEHGVLALERWLIARANKELRATAVWPSREQHRSNRT